MQTCPYTLRLKLSVRKEFVSQIKGCATGFDATGMTDAEIAAKDAEQVKLCEASTTATLQGRAGWIEYPGTSWQLTTLSYDASQFLTSKKMHIIFSFAINGRIQSYVLHNDYVPPSGT